MEYCAYILYSNKINKYYVGSSSDINSRVKYHNSEKNKIWTKKGQPWELKKTIGCENRSDALKLENKIKRMKSRKYIENLINE